MGILDFKTYHLYTNWLNNAAPVLGHHLVLYSEQGIVKTINIPNEVIKTIDKKDIWNCKDLEYGR